MQHVVSLLLLSVLFSFSSCTSMRSFGLKLSAPLFYNASNNVLNEKNFENIENGLAGNLILLEGLRSVRSDDEYLTTTLIKGYVGLAFAISETKYLNDKYSENDKIKNKNQTIFNYSKAVRLGEEFLENNNLSIAILEKALKNNKLLEVMDNELNENELHFNAIFFTAQAIASLINLQRDQMSLIARLPLVKGMFDWVCLKKPNFNHGSCDIFYASYESSRPRMLGGSPKRGKELFLNAIKKWPQNYLIREAYLEYYSIPMSDLASFQSQESILEKFSDKFKKDLSWKPYEKLNSTDGVGFYNAIAIKRFIIMKKFKNDFF